MARFRQVNSTVRTAIQVALQQECVKENVQRCLHELRVVRDTFRGAFQSPISVRRGSLLAYCSNNATDTAAHHLACSHPPPALTAVLGPRRGTQT